MNKRSFLKLIASYENIIFDYGGVLIDIDYHQSVKNLTALSSLDNPGKFYTQANQVHLFDQFETGKISNETFLIGLCDLLKIPLAKQQQAHDAWCSMLLDLKSERTQLLQEINQHKRIFILSNINSIHEDYMENYIDKKPEFEGFYDLFEKVYFSHHIGLRKPNQDIFEHVLNDANMDIKKTLFIDDSEQHILGAKSLGMNTYFLPSNTLLSK